MNKRKQEVHDLAICEHEAVVIREIFELAYTHGYGAQSIANHLNCHGYKNRSGANWHPATIQSIMRNVTYTGILRSGDTFSPVQENLRIIDDKTFNGVKAMLQVRSRKYQGTRSAPLNTRGKSLLAGNIFCGHCGARLCITTSGKGRPRADGTDPVRMRYCCQTRTRKHEDCGGQTGYTVSKVDGIIETVILSIFARVRHINREEIISARNENDLLARKEHIKTLKSDCQKAESDLKRLQGEIVKSLTGESVFSPEMLKPAIDAQEQKHRNLLHALQEAEKELADNESNLRGITEQFDDLLEWSSIYSHSDMAAKKTIVSHLIDRVDIFRDYDIKITLNISVEQFLNTIDLHS